MYVKSEHSIAEKWEKVLGPLKKHVLFCTEDLDIEATSLKRQFEDALDDFETANSLNDKAAGFEYHPDPTPYYELMCDIWIERKRYCNKMNAAKGKEKETHNAYLFSESNAIENSGGDNALRRMKDLNDAMNCNSRDEFEITDTPPLDEEPLFFTPSFTVKNRKKKTSPSTDSVNSARERDIDTVEANMQILKKYASL